MSTVIFGFGILVFLITVYGTVVTGGLLLTGRQLDEQPELDPTANQRDEVGDELKRRAVPKDY